MTSSPDTAQGGVQPRSVIDIHDLLAVSSLAEVRPFEIASRLTGQPREEAEPKLSLGYAELLTPAEIHTRFKLSVLESDVEYVADFAAIYTFDEEVTVPRAIAVEFAERVGFMTTFPFLRESVTTSAARMGRAIPIIGIMRPGDFRIETEDSV